MDADCKGEKEKDDLNDALDDFEGDPLNLTNEDK